MGEVWTGVINRKNCPAGSSPLVYCIKHPFRPTPCSTLRNSSPIGLSWSFRVHFRRLCCGLRTLSSIQLGTPVWGSNYRATSSSCPQIWWCTWSWNLVLFAASRLSFDRLSASLGRSHACRVIFLQWEGPSCGWGSCWEFWGSLRGWKWGSWSTVGEGTSSWDCLRVGWPADRRRTRIFRTISACTARWPAGRACSSPGFTRSEACFTTIRLSFSLRLVWIIFISLALIVFFLAGRCFWGFRSSECFTARFLPFCLGCTD